MGTDKATIRTYATCANYLGLFDDAGCKVSLYLETTAIRAKNNGLVIASYGDFPVPTDGRNLVHKIKSALFSDHGIEDGLILKVRNNLKDGGLGTSAASAVAFVELVNRLYELNLTQEQKVLYASRGEPNNHLDNVLPCILGGIVFSYRPEDEKAVPYQKFDAPPCLNPVLIIPLDITKEGGTQGAKDAIKDLKHTDEENQVISELKKSAIEGLANDDFEALRDVASAFLSWERSETFLRNQRNVYHIDILMINRLLEQKYGKKVIFTPSGAGPAMLVQAVNPEIARDAANDVVGYYASNSHQAKAEKVIIRNQPSIDDFVD